DRYLLLRFIILNCKLSDTRLSDVMGPLIKIDKNMSTKNAARKLVNTTFSRLCVFDGDKFLGWVALTELARESCKDHLLQVLVRDNTKSSVRPTMLD
ncbi:MAG: hypothetical protein JRN67_00895, partial [Nitrososphaerota archaeon]|nr:hypothetical protein [Nitrososphaerota archaeon]